MSEVSVSALGVGGRVLEHRRRQGGVVVVAPAELEHLQDLVSGRVGRRVGTADVHAGLGQHSVPVGGRQLRGALAVAGVGERDLVADKPDIPRGISLAAAGTEHLLGDQRVVGHAEHVRGLAELGDGLDHGHRWRRTASARSPRGVGPSECRDLLSERGGQGTGAEHDQRLAPALLGAEPPCLPWCWRYSTTRSPPARPITAMMLSV